MYKAMVRWMIRRNITALNEGRPEPALAMFADEAELDFPGSTAGAASSVTRRSAGIRSPPASDDNDAYENRAVLMMNTRWGRIRRQEDYEDTHRATEFDDYLERHLVATPDAPGGARVDAI